MSDQESVESVQVPMDMAQDLRQWAEALSAVENWTPTSHGTKTLRRYKTLLTAAALGAVVGGERQEDETWRCACGDVLPTDLALYGHLLGGLRRLRRPHAYCEDSWYSCPKAEEGCADDRQGDKCNCGADTHNALVDSLLALLPIPERAGETGHPMVDLLLDLVSEGWLPHPFVAHLSERCARCGSTADRAVHDRLSAEDRGITWGAVLAALSTSQGAPDA